MIPTRMVNQEGLRATPDICNTSVVQMFQGGVTRLNQYPGSRVHEG